jgi:tetratricopeptide (TPR) repeat protein
LGLSCIHLKKLAKAKGYLDKAIELNPFFADAYYRLGIIAEKEQNWKKAHSLYKKTLNILPDHLDSLKALKKIKEKSE